MIYSFTRGLFFVLFKLFYRLSISGKENIPESGAVIIVSNHTSYLDPIVLAVAVSSRPINFMAKEELFSIPVLNILVRKLRAFPVRRGKPDKSAFETALQVLLKSEILGLFPEGTRRRLGRLQLGPGERGAAVIALKSKAPIIPVAIIGTDKVMMEEKKLPRFPKIRVIIGKSFIISDEGDKKERINKAVNKIMQAILTLLKENIDES